jgi:hypothetical protein
LLTVAHIDTPAAIGEPTPDTEINAGLRSCATDELVDIQPEPTALRRCCCRGAIIDAECLTELLSGGIGLTKPNFGEIGGVGHILLPVAEVKPTWVAGIESRARPDIEFTILIDAPPQEPGRPGLALDLFADWVEAQAVGIFNIDRRP